MEGLQNNLIHGVFFFSSRRRHTRSLRDWSSDVCSSDVRAIEGSDAIRLSAGELQRVGLAKNRRERIHDAAPGSVDGLDQRLWRLLPSRDAAAIELLCERLPLARRSEVEAHHSCNSDRRSHRGQRRKRGSKPLIHLVRVSLCLWIEAADGEKIRIGERELTPAAKVVVAVQQKISGAERIPDLERECGALWHPALQRIERD